MFKTKITELFGIEYPIVGGTMMWLSRAELVAAISNGGGLGVLASAIFKSKEEFRDELQKLKSLTKKPFAVNLNMFPSMRPIKNEDYIEVLLDEGVKIVETSGHQAPTEYVPPLKSAGVKLIHKCVGVKYARKAESLGVDAVTVVGYENGGATGELDIATMVLIPTVADAVRLPVIGGGGIANGRGLLAALALGAEGVIIGSRFLLSEECPIHPKLKEALIKANERDTMLIMRSLRATHRVWVNEAAMKVKELEEKQAGLEELFPYIAGERAREMFEGGELSRGILACGQCIGLIREIKPAGEIIKDIMREATAVYKSLEPKAG
ncbi:MAG: NADH:ubiquinone reductase [Myxococcota bacterium]